MTGRITDFIQPVDLVVGHDNAEDVSHGGLSGFEPGLVESEGEHRVERCPECGDPERLLPPSYTLSQWALLQKSRLSLLLLCFGRWT